MTVWLVDLPLIPVFGSNDTQTPYSAKTSHPAATIAIGTSNDDVGWANGSSNWSTAGTQWALLMDGITAPTNVTLEAGNDVEGWAYGSSWYAYGSDANSWENAFQSEANTLVSYYGSIPFLNIVLDYGNEAYAVLGSPYWTQAQVYDMAWGNSSAIVAPEIYCSGQQTHWANLYSLYNQLYFEGVSTENGAAQANCYGNTQNTTYTWIQSWNQLNTAITNAGNSNDVGDVDTNF